MAAESHNYPDWAIERAQSRGYDHEVHLEVLELGDEEQITLTHPYNWLTEDEVELISYNGRPWTEAEKAALDAYHGDTLHPNETPEGGPVPAPADR